MMVEVTNHRVRHQASASCAVVRPCFLARAAYSSVAVRASDLV